MRLLLLLLLLLLVPLEASAAARPLTGATQPAQQPTAVSNAAIAAQATAAVAAGRPANWLVSFQTSEAQVVQQAQVISTAVGLVTPTAQHVDTARLQLYSALKASVLSAAAAVAPRGGGVASPQSSVQVVQDYTHLPVMLVSINSAADLQRLQADPNVVSVTPDYVAQTASLTGFEFVGQPAATAKGFTGSGTVVVIDTGLDYRRSAFGSCTAPNTPAATCKVLYAQDLAGNDNVLDDSTQHGTNVAGIIATVAPGVKLITLDVFSPAGASFSTISGAINWAVANRQQYNITAINLSLGAKREGLDCEAQSVSVAIESAAAWGLMSVAAAGNYGNKADILIPACASKAVAVGAIYATSVASAGWTIKESPCTSNCVCNDYNVVPDTVTCFSNSNSKVALLAPGYEIAAADTDPISGTSQATPFVTAAIMVVRARYPDYTQDQVLSLLTSTGKPVTDPANGLTIPRLNLRATMGISCSPQLSPSTMKASSTGGTYTLTVTPPTPDCTWTVAAPTASWMRLVGTTTGTGPGTVTVQVDPAATVARSTGVTVAAPDGASSMLVSQPMATVSVVDTRAPVMGRLQATSVGGAVTLTWPAAKDSQSGVSSYRVVYNQGVKPPTPRCITGTPVNQQPQVSGSSMSLTVTGLTVGTRYTARVCAIDSAGNVAVGSFWRGKINA